MKTIYRSNKGYVVRHWPTPEGPEFSLSFEVMAVIGYEHETNDEVFKAAKGNGHTSNLDESLIYAHGDLKWDGCMNMNFDEQDRCMLHFCDVKDVTELMGVFQSIYTELGPKIPGWM